MISLHWRKTMLPCIRYWDYMSHSGSNFSGTPDSDYGEPTNFELSEFLKFDEWIEEDDQPSLLSASTQNPVYRAHVIGDSGLATSTHGGPSIEGREQKEGKERVAFKTKTEVEILDDGFKWRKYGKKMVKNSPNPSRNYYRCSVEGCHVKKRIERDREDQSYVITTYEGVHNHPSSS
ncbi:probable WRKY transcription factor 50 isoform X1 [Hevea brasiliensis]|uniref:probable WRKY transcription factor 50 isoform X1 n=1 Tax=Hevea brasiliensis TaxID=3981 RepID=UPI000B797E30|nr:probable WRKY transcription factor 50 isoform X1 [Hevea brasiliensis]